jgi:hypothetical protein
MTTLDCPVFLSWTIVKNCMPCTIECDHIFRFLFVRGLTIIFLVSEMGIQDQQNSPCEVLILIHVIYFLWGWAKEQVY